MVMQSQLGRKTILKEMIQPQGRTVLHAGDIAHVHSTYLSVCWRYCTRPQYVLVCMLEILHTPAALVGMLKLLFAISSRQNMHAVLQSQLILGSVGSGCRDLFRADREFCRGLRKIEGNTCGGEWGGE